MISSYGFGEPWLLHFFIHSCTYNLITVKAFLNLNKNVIISYLQIFSKKI